MLDALKKIVSAGAPILGAALGGPFGGVAGAMISRALTGSENATEEEMIRAYYANPNDLLLKLKQAENDFILESKRLDIQHEKLSYDDIANARKRDTEKDDDTARNLAYAITAGFFIILIMMLFIPIQQNMEQVALVMFGALTAAFTGITTFYFGSSIGSKIKDLKK